MSLRQAVRRFVAAGAILLERLHHDPVEIAARAGWSSFAGVGSAERCATVVRSSAAIVLDRRVEGFGGSTSRMMRRISSRPAASSVFGSNGGWPVSSS